MKQEFISAVIDNDLAKVRISLTNELLLEPSGVTFSEMLSYAINKLPKLFEENKEANYVVPPQEEWDEKFMFKVKNDLDSNFSREKIAFYETVVKEVGKHKVEGIEQDEREEQEQQYTDFNMGQRYHINKTYATVSAGGATIALVGLIAGKTLLTVVGSAILVVGGVLLLNDKMENK